MPECRRMVVSGRVQGVFFREWTVATARELGLTGWVRNRTDGTVEILAMGTADQLDRFTARLHEGSPTARVDAVQVAAAEPEALDGFARRPTA